MTSVSPDNYSTADPYVSRSAPWNPEAEQAVLGAMLLDQDAALRAAELVDDAMFYREGHRRLFRAMLALVERRSKRPQVVETPADVDCHTPGRPLHHEAHARACPGAIAKHAAADPVALHASLHHR